MAKFKEYTYLIFAVLFLITTALLFIRNCEQEGKIADDNTIIEQLTEENESLSRTNGRLADTNKELESTNIRLDYAIRRESEINKRQAETIRRLQSVSEEIQEIRNGLQGIGKEIYDDIEAAKKIVQECLDN